MGRGRRGRLNEFYNTLGVFTIFSITVIVSLLAGIKIGRFFTIREFRAKYFIMLSKNDLEMLKSVADTMSGMIQDILNDYVKSLSLWLEPITSMGKTLEEWKKGKNLEEGE